MAVAPPDFKLLFQSAPSLLIVLDPGPDFRIVAVSDAYLRATRAAREAVVGRGFFEVFPETHEGPRATGSGSLVTALERVRSTRTADALNAPVLSADGRLLYIIHRIDSIELEVLRSARERDDAIRRLKTANEELEAFVYSASHDLRAPLRAIDGFCRVFEQIEAGALDSGVRRLLLRIGANVERMEAIIDDLLKLSRIGRTRMVRGRVDVTGVALQVIGEIKARDPQREATFEVAEGMEAWADEGLVRTALENLIGNAWKYTARKPHAHIQVGRRSVVGQNVFYVKDNGAGFDMARASILFAPFVRLHGAEEFEGHGIGLATVRRVMERHGGEIWAESQPEVGTTMNFTLTNNHGGSAA